MGTKSYIVDASNVPIVGQVSLLTRLRGEDRNLINTAAGQLELTQAQFMRMALVNMAKAVINKSLFDVKDVGHGPLAEKTNEKDSEQLKEPNQSEPQSTGRG